jgi:hypothetical protein
MFNIDLIPFSIAIISIAAFALPFYLNGRKVKLRERQAQKLLADFTLYHGLNLKDKDQWRDKYFIGLDKEKAQVVYNGDISQNNYKCIRLDQIKRVSITEVSHQVTNGKKSHKELDRLDLILINQNEKPIHVLEFYDGDQYSDLVGEAVLIKKWEALLKDSIKNMPKHQLAP